MHTVGTLKAALIKKGLPTGGRKADLISRLSTGFQFPKDVKRILSLDLGSKNCAMAVIDVHSAAVEHWQLYDIRDERSEGQMSVRELGAAAKAFHADHIKPLVDEDPLHTLTVVERQRYRTGGASSVLDSAMINVLLEAVLSVLAGESGWLSVEPKAVARYYNLPSGYAAKKKAAVQLVAEHVRVGRVGGIVAEAFLRSKKKDDLADALLQAWAVRDWITGCSASSANSASTGMVTV